MCNHEPSTLAQWPAVSGTLTNHWTHHLDRQRLCLVEFFYKQTNSIIWIVTNGLFSRVSLQTDSPKKLDKLLFWLHLYSIKEGFSHLELL
jgi:hypothetical protein